MDTNTLVMLNEFSIQIGKTVLSKLDENGIDVKGAFWFYFSEANEWRLLLVVPSVDIKGPREIYSKIQWIIIKNNLNINLWSIGVISPGYSINQLLRTAIKTDEKSISDIRFSGNVINGVLIEDAYIYRIN